MARRETNIYALTNNAQSMVKMPGAKAREVTFDGQGKYEPTALAVALKAEREGENGATRKYSLDIGKAIEERFPEATPELVEAWWLSEDARQTPFAPIVPV